jgi:hypothetical protein
VASGVWRHTKFPDRSPKSARAHGGIPSPGAEQRRGQRVGPAARSEERGARSQNAKHELLARLLKSNQCAPRPVFLRMCRHVTSKQHLRSKNFAPRSWWSCSATASGSPAASSSEQRGRAERVTRGHISPPPLTSFERFQPKSAY